jgi:hypothetical protein
VRVWRWSKRNPKFAGALAASIVLAMLNLLAIFALSHLLSSAGHARFAHQIVASVRFQDFRELAGSLNSITDAMKSLDAADAKVEPAPVLTEEAEANSPATPARHGIDP